MENILRLFVAIDGPAVVIEDRRFRGVTIEIVCQPTYGRVLFTQHGVSIRNCFFER